MKVFLGCVVFGFVAFFVMEYSDLIAWHWRHLLNFRVK